MSVTLVIPAYNEEARLRPFLATIARYHKKNPLDISEIIVVDDGSTDATANVARSFAPLLHQLHVISYAINRGKGAAIREGVLAAHGDIVVFMDADGATAIDEFPKMIQAMQGNEIAVGSRWMSTSQADRSSFFRHLAGWTYRRYMQLLGIGEIDTMCGFKGYQRQVARELFTNLLEPRWLFDTEIAYRAIRRHYRINNFPIRWESKEGSKLSGRTLVATAFQIWPLIQKIKQQEAYRKSIP